MHDGHFPEWIWCLHVIHVVLQSACRVACVRVNKHHRLPMLCAGCRWRLQHSSPMLRSRRCSRCRPASRGLQESNGCALRTAACIAGCQRSWCRLSSGVTASLTETRLSSSGHDKRPVKLQGRHASCAGMSYEQPMSREHMLWSDRDDMFHHAGHAERGSTQHQAAAGHRQPVPVGAAVPVPTAGRRLFAHQLLSPSADR